MSPLHVIAVVSNPIRFASRYRLYREFQERMLGNPAVVLHTVELAYGHRPFEITKEGVPNEYQFRSHEELWHKENLINLGIQRLPASAEYIAWVDADVNFVRPDWAEETVQQLQHYKVVQMFTHATDLGPQYQPLHQHLGYIYAWQNGMKPSPRYCKPYGPGGLVFHPGFAWACRRDVLDNVGQLIDFSILGSGDTHMAGALTNVVEKTFHKGISSDYKKALLNYQRLCDNYVRQKVGCVETLLVHYWHGKKRDRGYGERWQVLSDAKYSPYTDLIRDSHGLIRLTSEKRELRDGIMRYFRTRNEDSIDL